MSEQTSAFRLCVVRIAKAASLLWLAANAADRACRSALVMVADVRGLRFAQNKVLDSVVGPDAVDVMHDFATLERSAEMVFHHEPMHEIGALPNGSDEIAQRIQRRVSTLPCCALVSMQFLEQLMTAVSRTGRMIVDDVGFSAFKRFLTDGADIRALHVAQYSMTLLQGI